MKILVVDDDHEIVELLSIYLKNEGYEPIAAYNGKEALTKLSTTPDIALMILDVMMPNMSGIDVVKEVRKDSDIPIIIVSAKTGDMDKIQGLITGPTTTCPSLSTPWKSWPGSGPFCAAARSRSRERSLTFWKSGL